MDKNQVTPSVWWRGGSPHCGHSGDGSTGWPTTSPCILWVTGVLLNRAGDYPESVEIGDKPPASKQGTSLNTAIYS